jgi:hypothetical protein
MRPPAYRRSLRSPLKAGQKDPAAVDMPLRDASQSARTERLRNRLVADFRRNNPTILPGAPAQSLTNGQYLQSRLGSLTYYDQNAAGATVVTPACGCGGSNEAAYFTVTGGARAGGSPFDLSGDFTIEWFQTMTKDEGGFFPRVFSFGSFSDPSGAAFAVSLEQNSFYTWIDGSGYPLFPDAIEYQPVKDLLVHFAIVRSGSTVTVYKNGGEGQTGNQFIYADPISVGDKVFTIRNETVPSAGAQFYGSISSFRWTNAAVYTTETFPVPTEPLTELPETVLLIKNFPTSGSSTANGFTVTRYGTAWS